MGPDVLDAMQLLACLETYGLKIILAPTEEFVRQYLTKYQQKVIHVSNHTERKRLFALLEQHR